MSWRARVRVGAARCRAPRAVGVVHGRLVQADFELLFARVVAALVAAALGLDVRRRARAEAEDGEERHDAEDGHEVEPAARGDADGGGDPGARRRREAVDLLVLRAVRLGPHLELPDEPRAEEADAGRDGRRDAARVPRHGSVLEGEDGRDCKDARPQRHQRHGPDARGSVAAPPLEADGPAAHEREHHPAAKVALAGRQPQELRVPHVLAPEDVVLVAVGRLGCLDVLGQALWLDERRAEHNDEEDEEKREQY
mmetsp:Transcript_22334/g.75546  ORF Transcript_22334/g.75546 Transcript_22334/m.75546 type:complete len:254 (+) Transcript_22334:110-871(+)